MSALHHLATPLRSQALGHLRAGDQVLLSGTLITARDAAHERFSQAIEAGEDLPFNPEGEVIYFVGPTPARPGKVIGSAGPTTASRMDPYSPLLISRGLKGMVGKGRRSHGVKRSMLDNGCVYFGAIEGTAALLAQQITAAEIIAYRDLGTEAVQRLTVIDFPVVVVNDLHGNDLYEDGPEQWRQPQSWE